MTFEIFMNKMEKLSVVDFKRKRPSCMELLELRRQNSCSPVSPMGRTQAIKVTNELKDSGNSTLYTIYGGMSSEAESKPGKTPKLVLPDKP